MAASEQGRPKFTSTLKNNKLSTTSERGTFQPGAAPFIDSGRVAASGCHQNTAWSAIINHIYYEGDVFGHDFRVDLFADVLLKRAPPRLDTATFTLVTHNQGPHEASAGNKRSPDWHLVSMPTVDTAWRTVSVGLMSGGDSAQYQPGKLYQGLTTQMKTLQKRLHLQQVWRICLRFEVEKMAQVPREAVWVRTLHCHGLAKARSDEFKDSLQMWIKTQPGNRALSLHYTFVQQAVSKRFLRCNLYEVTAIMPGGETCAGRLITTTLVVKMRGPMTPGCSKLFDQASLAGPGDLAGLTTHSASSVRRPMMQPHEPAATCRHDDREQQQQQIGTENPLELMEAGEGSQPFSECWTASEDGKTGHEGDDIEDAIDTEAFVNAYGETMIARHLESYHYW
ncbi:hypothetical protein CDD81_2317 [Ophiocordyceps australis]|uniref:Uncharacterized protein n=1 Tax=Ophiocordyceps australis TaxID=1399860 RepID=A0A2C5YA01_9HYPO|nr:hypothetical protein CDD81_2317 [Ophiocordyceps australis]